MRPIDFEEKNLILHKPSNMTDEECNSLPVCKTAIPPINSDLTRGATCYISKWKGGWLDRVRYLFTGTVWVSILQNSHPPISLRTDSPFTLNNVPRPRR